MTVVLAPPLLLVKEKLAKTCPTAAILCTLELGVIVWNSGYVTTTNKKNTPCCKVISL